MLQNQHKVFTFVLSRHVFTGLVTEPDHLFNEHILISSTVMLNIGFRKTPFIF